MGLWSVPHLCSERNGFCVQFHWISFWSGVLLLILAVLFYAHGDTPFGHVIMIWNLCLFIQILLPRYHKNQLCVTNKRLVHYSHSILGTSVVHSIFLEDIKDIRIHQGLLGRWLGFGSVIITGPLVGGKVDRAKGGPKVEWRGVRSKRMHVAYVSWPAEFEEQVQRQLQEYAKEPSKESLPVETDEKQLREKVSTRWYGGTPGCLIMIVGIGLMIAGAPNNNKALFAIGFSILLIGGLVRHGMED